ncbi:MAG: hypothetical protein IKL90_00980 [Alphaproteobacteria bacterium]|nr:hypothetical protein [Alphaproteobacteria bacterium]
MANTTNLLEALSSYQGDQPSLRRFVETATQELGDNWTETIYQTLPNLPSGLKEKLDHAFQYHGATLSWNEIQSYLSSSAPLDITTVSTRVEPLSYWLKFFGEAGETAIQKLKDKLDQEKENQTASLIKNQSVDQPKNNEIIQEIDDPNSDGFEEESSLNNNQEIDSYNDPMSLEPETSNEKYPQEEYTGETYEETPYTQEEYAGETYEEAPYTQEDYAGETYEETPYTQEEYMGETYEETPYTQEEYAGETYEETPYTQEEYASETYEETQYTQEEYAGETYEETPYTQEEYAGETYEEAPYTQEEYMDETYEEYPYTQEEYIENEQQGSVEDMESPFWRTPVYKPEKQETNEEFMAKKVFHQLDFLTAVRCWINARCISLGNKEIYSYRHYGFLIDLMEETKKDLEIVLASPTFYPAIEQVRAEGLKLLQSALKALESDLKIAYDNLPSELTDLISDSTNVDDLKKMLGALDTSNKPELLGVAPDGFEMLEDPFDGIDTSKTKITSSQSDQNSIQKKKTFSFNKKNAS